MASMYAMIFFGLILKQLQDCNEDLPDCSAIKSLPAVEVQARKSFSSS